MPDFVMKLYDKALRYALDLLQLVNPLLVFKSYRTAIKLRSPCFCGNDIISAFIAGYHEKERELKQDNNE